MSRNAITYQAEDRVFFEGLVQDAALAATLTSLTAGWRGFADPLAKADISQPVAAGVSGLATDPAATATYRVGYGTDLSDRKALDGNLLCGLPALLYVTLIVQPFVAMTLIDSLTTAIRTSFRSQALAAGMPFNVSVPVARGRDLGTWSTWPMILRGFT